jgi:hypothetical protein
MRVTAYRYSLAQVLKLDGCFHVIVSVDTLNMVDYRIG